MSHIAAMPVFPLHTVLFPKQLLRLHIFEARYRQMVQECLVGGDPFGVVLIREGQDVGEPATPFQIGTTARIRAVDRLDDGRMNILCTGESRFVLNALHHDRVFLTGDAELWPWEPLPPDEVEPRQTQLGRLLSVYMNRLAEAMNQIVHISNLPDNIATLANLSAIALQIPQHEKQDLLALSSVRELVDGCIDLLQREIRVFSVVSTVPTILTPGGFAFSDN